MAENYSLGSKFGFNITSGGAKQAQKSNVEINQASKNLFNSLGAYVDKYENVFNGDIEKEINMYSRQTMIVGMNLKAGEVKRSFDVNI